MNNKRLFVSLVPFYVLILVCFLFVGIAGSRAITVIAENEPLSQRKCVIIDPGHGGIDSGATSCSGVAESAINLEIALRLNDLLHLLGIQTQMTRSTDTSIHTSGNTVAAQKVSDLKERVRIANSAENAILISIHQNHFTDNRYSGAQVFYALSAESIELADKLQTALVKNLNPGSNRVSKRGESIYLLQNAKAPAVLIECGFLSNYEEEAKLRSANYQKKLATVISAVCSVYLYETE